MPDITYGPKFRKSSSKLENKELERLAGLLKCLAVDTYHPLLHTKHLTGPLEGLLSFRIGRDYRCIFRILNDKTVFLLEISHRKNIYN